MLSQAVKDAIFEVAYQSQAQAREEHAADPQALHNIDQMVDMLYDWQLKAFETYDKPILAAVYREAYLDGAMHGIGPLALENPYDQP